MNICESSIRRITPWLEDLGLKNFIEYRLHFDKNLYRCRDSVECSYITHGTYSEPRFGPVAFSNMDDLLMFRLRYL